METIAFVILHYGDRRVTDACVDSILRMEGQAQLRIVLVDNEIKKPDGQRRALREAYERKAQNLSVVPIRENGGFSHANNCGYRYAREQLRADFILVLNNDIEFTQKDFPDRLLRQWRENRCAVMAPDIVRRGTGEHQNPMDTRLRTREEAERTIRRNAAALKFYGLLYPFLSWNFKRTEKSNTKSRINDAEFRSPREDIVPFGACLIFTPDFVEGEDRAFEPETCFYYEEYILAARCQRKGYRIRYLPELQMLHESGSATGEKGGRKRMRFIMECTMESCGVYLDYIGNM